MGGGNGLKSATKRARDMAKASKPPQGSQLKNNAASQTISCKICLQTFVATSSEKVLKEHWESKHPKAEFMAAFPHLSS